MKSEKNLGQILLSAANKNWRYCPPLVPSLPPACARQVGVRVKFTGGYATHPAELKMRHSPRGEARLWS